MKKKICTLLVNTLLLMLIAVNSFTQKAFGIEWKNNYGRSNSEESSSYQNNLFTNDSSHHIFLVQANKQDSLALVDLYDSTDGPHWTHHGGWLTKRPLITWYGIVVTNGRVTYLSLHGNNLMGILPSSIGNLSKLSQLYVGFNKITGNLPASLGNLINLNYLDLDFNDFNGTIPSTLGNLINVTYLGFSNNQLTGQIPPSLGNMTKLNEVDLSHNHLTGNIPPELGMLAKNHANLILDHNNLSGFISKSLDSLYQYAQYYFNNNAFTFAGLERFVQKHPYTEYAPQASIPLTKSNNIFSVHPGGTLAKDTFRWYKNNVLVATQVGDSNFTATVAGQYYATVTNAIAKDLTLYSDTVFYTGFADESLTHNSIAGVAVLRNGLRCTLK